MIPPASTWDVEQWKFNNRDQVQALTDEQLIAEWKELTQAIQIFFKYRAIMTMEMTWLFSAIVHVATERNLDLRTDTMPV